ncbi:hypothetical protein C8F01DRAFT_1308333 [Mycena amicta]|nr:hypothetical protein C8F01DRAFT_1308333 [Mycena amicta]
MTATEPITIIFDDVLAVDESASDPTAGVVANPPDAIYPSKYSNTIVIFDLVAFSQAGKLEFQVIVPFLRAFDGSTVQLYGIAPPPQFNQTFIIGPAGEWEDYSYRAPGYGGLHYTSPPNSITNSALMVTQARGFALDYAVVTVYPRTDLLGTTILVDDSSSSLIWRGSWTEENNFTLPVICVLPLTVTPTSKSLNNTAFTANMAPHANTTHTSQTVGDEFEFWFTGTSVLVYGVTPFNTEFNLSPWLLQMSFTLDAAEPIMVNLTSQEFVDLDEMPHLVYFNASSIPAGNHSLVGRVVDVAGSTLPRARIDYITYKPSFASQAEMPVLPPFASTMASSTTTATSSTSPTSSSEAASGGSAKVEIIRTAVGGAMGAILLCAVAVALVVYMRRRQRRNRSRYQVDEPFLGSSESDGYIIPVGEKRGTMRLGNDAVRRVHAGPPAARNVSQLLVDTPAVHGDELEQLPVAAPQENPEMDSRFRELQTQVQQLRQEVREQILPPAYEGDAA